MPLVVLISGNGSNLQAIIDEIQRAALSVKIELVISNRADAYGLKRARQANIDTAVLDHRDYPDRKKFDRALAELIDQFDRPLVVMAGFMRILSDEFVNRYHGRLINIHPSLLPKYRGLNTHQRVLAAGDKHHGASVHFVTPDLDAGPVILQGRVDVLAGDTEDSLRRRVHEMEHLIYPRVVRWFANHQVQLEGDSVLIAGLPITEDKRIFELTPNEPGNAG